MIKIANNIEISDGQDTLNIEPYSLFCTVAIMVFGDLGVYDGSRIIIKLICDFI